MEVKSNDIPRDDGDGNPQSAFCQTASESSVVMSRLH